MDKIKTYIEPRTWKAGMKLVYYQLSGKQKVHASRALHFSTHLLVIKNKLVLCRKRADTENRYAGLYTTTIGTHLINNDTFLDPLKKFFPYPKLLMFCGEFRVKDKWENEVNALYIAQINKEYLDEKFMQNRYFFELSKLYVLIKQKKCTPHLKAAIELIS